jgi:hypothetical protein
LLDLVQRTFRTTLSIQWVTFWGLGATYTDCWDAYRAARHRELDAVARQTNRFLRLLRRFARKNPSYSARRLIVEGQVARLSGHPQRARELWRAAVAAAATLRLKADEALAHYELGRIGMAGGAERIDHLDRARALFLECGMPHEVALVDTALASGASEAHTSGFGA